MKHTYSVRIRVEAFNAAMKRGMRSPEECAKATMERLAKLTPTLNSHHPVKTFHSLRKRGGIFNKH